MSLTKDQRDRLSDDQFAVPGTRSLPIHDERHVRMAWSQLSRISALSDSERDESRRRIICRAKDLGLDCSGWELHALAFCLDAMSLAVPDVDGHPNRMPFSGILTRVDESSDAPPHGSNGNRTFISSAVAEQAIPSLLGMAVDYTKDFDGHDKKSKIGVITDAKVNGNAIEIAGFLYASDFPEECARIREEKNRLGFSYECQAAISDLEADPWVITHCVFTGAALLYKDLAAYQTTSLSAKAEKDTEMELKEIMDAVAKLSASITTLGDEVKTIKAASAPADKLLDVAAARDKVKPHADALRGTAASMEAAGIGLHATRGHVNTLRHMAASMEADAAMGNVPHIYNDHDYLSRTFEAGAEKSKPVDTEVTKQIATLSASIADIGTKLTDLSAKAFTNAKEPERKTISPEIKTLLAKAGLTDVAEAGTMTVEVVDKTLAAAGIKGRSAMEAKLKLQASGLLIVA